MKRQRMKNSIGWYHSASVGMAGEIWFYDGEGNAPDGWGPFQTWSEAKKDAIDYHRTDIRLARAAIQKIRSRVRVYAFISTLKKKQK